MEWVIQLFGRGSPLCVLRPVQSGINKGLLSEWVLGIYFLSHGETLILDICMQLILWDLRIVLWDTSKERNSSLVNHLSNAQHYFLGAQRAKWGNSTKSIFFWGGGTFCSRSNIIPKSTSHGNNWKGICLLCTKHYDRNCRTQRWVKTVFTLRGSQSSQKDKINTSTAIIQRNKC